jgi:hypothetical protein
MAGAGLWYAAGVDSPNFLPIMVLTLSVYKPKRSRHEYSMALSILTDATETLVRPVVAFSEDEDDLAADDDKGDDFGDDDEEEDLDGFEIEGGEDDDLNADEEVA